MWIEIFKTGTHTTKNGSTKSYTEADLDRMAQKYNPQYHEAPVAIGDISDKGPAYGWVGKLKREGGRLLAWIDQAHPTLVDAIRKGTVRKKTVAFYPDLSLRSIAFSGPASPIASGNCGQFEFAASSNGACIEFSEGGDLQKEINRKILEVLDNPPEYDEFGRKWVTFQPLKQALNYVMAKNPDLKTRIDQQTLKDYVAMIRPLFESTFCEQAGPAGILQRKTLEVCLDRGCSYGEAFNEACLENPETARQYAEIIQGVSRRNL